MAGPVQILDVGVVAAALIGIADQNRQARPGRATFEDAGKNLRFVRLLPLGDDFALSRAAALEVHTKIIDRQRQTGRHAVNDDDVPRAVALAGGGDPKCLSE
mgnify:CR=1 FL=1